MQLGELVIPDGYYLEVDDLDSYRDDELLILTTGSQGEPMSGLTRMAFSEHRKLQIKPSDKVIISATPIPGNEKFVSRVINQLYRCGAEVIYEAMAEVHVSGHACQEEIKLMHALVKPKYFIPIHGEYRMLWQHAELAEAMGMDRQNIVLPAAGQVIEMSQDSLAIAGTVPTGEVLVDGLGIGDVGNVVLRDRKHLSQDGLIIVAMAFDRTNGVLCMCAKTRTSSSAPARWCGASSPATAASRAATGPASRTASRMSCTAISTKRSSAIP